MTAATIFKAGFRAMGTTVEFLSVREPADGAVAGLECWFEYVERHLSRFRPSSELCLLNASAGRPFIASPLLIEVLTGALAAAEETNGVFDPTILANLEASGYRTSFSELGPIVDAGPIRQVPGWRSIDVTADGVVTLADGVTVDLGGYAKGWTVDRAGGLLPNASWLLNAGGDIRANGDGPRGMGWLIGIEDPLALGNDLLILRVRDRAVATSTTMRRRWLTSDGKFAHHLIDPRTGLPSKSDLASVTVVANTVSEAEVQAKVLLLLGRKAAVERAYSEGLPVVLIDTMGEPTIVRSGDAFSIA